MKTIFSYKGTIFFAAIAGITLIFLPFLQANAQSVDRTVEIKDKSSYGVACHEGFAIITKADKLKHGESKTVGCDTQRPTDIHLKAGIQHGEESERVFYCNHDNPLKIAGYSIMYPDKVFK